MLAFIKYRAIWASWVVGRIFEWGYLGSRALVGPESYPPPRQPRSLNHGGVIHSPLHALYGSHGLSTGTPVYMPVDTVEHRCGTLGANPCSYDVRHV